MLTWTNGKLFTVSIYLQVIIYTFFKVTEIPMCFITEFYPVLWWEALRNGKLKYTVRHCLCCSRIKRKWEFWNTLDSEDT